MTLGYAILFRFLIFTIFHIRYAVSYSYQMGIKGLHGLIRKVLPTTEVSLPEIVSQTLLVDLYGEHFNIMRECFKTTVSLEMAADKFWNSMEVVYADVLEKVNFFILVFES